MNFPSHWLVLSTRTFRRRIRARDQAIKLTMSQIHWSNTFEGSILARLLRENLLRVGTWIQEPPAGHEWKVGDENVRTLNRIQDHDITCMDFVKHILQIVSNKGDSRMLSCALICLFVLCLGTTSARCELHSFT